MEYNIRRDNFKNFAVFEDNKLEPRAYFVPFSTGRLASKFNVLERRYSSDKIKVLNGLWDFKYYASVANLPEILDTAKIEFDQIPVPSCWQMLGYEPPFYTNVKYPFKVKPPKIPTIKPAGSYGEDVNGTSYACGDKQYNSVGVYRTFVDIKNVDKTFIISFYGVASNLELYVNGQYVGYSEGSHNTAEFLLDQYVSKGENEIVALVYKWCNGSYLEDQDMFRHNGIFRDVCLYVGEKSYIYDFDFFTTQIMKGYYDVILSVNVVNPVDTKVDIKLITPQGDVLVEKQVKSSADTKIIFDKLKVIEWNAEIPTLYKLQITLKKKDKVIECVHKEVGFKTIRTEKRVFLFNDKPIKMKGVNHHDTDHKTGYYLTPEQIYLDMKICKDYNINTVRTAHYPPDPLLIEVADQLGLYIIDEADIETHGVLPRGLISNNLKWKEHYWDRVKRMYARDKNSPSIAMWSLGNESGGIKCQDYCYEELKKLTSVPIHYERALVYKRGGYDVVSCMYFTPGLIEKVAKLKIKGEFKATKAKCKNKPFFVCEYAHAMGVGAGSLKEYWDVFYKYDSLLGGCVWEMIDHAILHKGKKYKYTYGGDHGEYTHDSNFCVDGLFYPDRTPHTGALAVKNVYRPIRARYIKPNVIELTNTNRFLNTKDLTIKAEILIDGLPTFESEIPSDIDPMKSKEFKLSVDAAPEGDVVINLDYYNGDKIVATEQLIVNEELAPIELRRGNSISAMEKGNQYVIKFDNGEILFNKTFGSLASYKLANVEYLSSKPIKQEGKGALYTNIYRAPIDNDMYVKRFWHMRGYDQLTHNLKSIDLISTMNEIIITTVKSLTGKKGTRFLVKEVYKIKPNGAINVAVDVKILHKISFITPRVGTVIELKDEFDDVYYYGYGPYENYPDFKEQARLGVYNQKVAQFLQPYIRPQESGNKTGVRYAIVKNKKGAGLMFIAENKPFNLGAKHISDYNLAQAKHIEDLVFDNVSYVHIDGAMGGVGSNSCGPLPLKQYRLREKNYKFSYTIVPFTNVDDGQIVF